VRTTPEALRALATPKAMKLFERYGVLSNRELQARVDVHLEKYNAWLDIEARTMIQMLRTQVMPPALRHQESVARMVAATRSAGAVPKNGERNLKNLVTLVDELERVDR